MVRRWILSASFWFVHEIIRVQSFSPKNVDHVICHSARGLSCQSLGQRQGDVAKQTPTASIIGHVHDHERSRLELALKMAGFDLGRDQKRQDANSHFEYSFSRATGMLKLETKSGLAAYGSLLESPPKWIPLVKNMENILVANGWSFLDPDDSEDMSAFNVEAANLEGQYKPTWGQDIHDYLNASTSKLGFSFQRMSVHDIQSEALSNLNNDLTRQVLLEGATDPPNIKNTHNGYSFRGSVQTLTPGIFVCALGGLPLFTTQHLSPTTASSGWLSFSHPVSEDHIQLIHPNSVSPDQRIEVVCAKSGCHLGHYFGRSNGYCINASVLNFIPKTTTHTNVNIHPPQSWWALEQSPLLYSIMRSLTATKIILLGAGCFWHVEFALRRLPGVVSSQVGYAGGFTLPDAPSYEQVCSGHTGHAEVVKIEFDPSVLQPCVLFDCFLALHDPTKVRAHGKHTQGTGQYRSCIFIEKSDAALTTAAQCSLDKCRQQLGKDLSTEIQDMPHFWTAEERHQRHQERRNVGLECSTIPSPSEWLKEYGKRSPTIMGSAATINTLTST